MKNKMKNSFWLQMRPDGHEIRKRKGISDEKTKGCYSWGEIVISTHIEVGPKHSWQFLLLIKVTYMKISFNFSLLMMNMKVEFFFCVHPSTCVCILCIKKIFHMSNGIFLLLENFSFWVKSAMHFINVNCSSKYDWYCTSVTLRYCEVHFLYFSSDMVLWHVMRSQFIIST